MVGMLDGEGAAVIRDANAGLTCAAGDGAGLAQVVRAMAAMTPDERRALGRNGLQYAKKEFGRMQLMDRLEDLLRGAVASAGANVRKTD